jgi:hypothetical protein
MKQAATIALSPMIPESFMNSDSDDDEWDSEFEVEDDQDYTFAHEPCITDPHSPRDGFAAKTPAASSSMDQPRGGPGAGAIALYDPPLRQVSPSSSSSESNYSAYPIFIWFYESKPT